MGLWKALQRAFSSQPTPRQVLDRLAELEDVQARRELEWAETKLQIRRHTARLAELDRRAEIRAGHHELPEARGKPSVQELLAMKYPRAAS
jgi:hypothetical protein